MNQEPNNTPNQQPKYYKPVVMTVLIILAVFFVFWKFNDIIGVINTLFGYISPVLYGIVIAYILNPIVNFFQRNIEKSLMKSKREKTRAKAPKTAKTLGILIAVVFGVCVVVLMCLLIIPSLLQSIIDLANQAGPILNKALEQFNKIASGESVFGENFKNIIESITHTLQDWITTNLLPTATSALELLVSGVTEVVGFVYNIVIGVIVAVYALAEKKKFVAGAKKIVFVLFQKHRANKILDTARHGNDIFGGFVSGTIIDSIIVFIICFIFCVSTGMPYPLLLATIVGITNVIPFFGPFIGGIPTALLVLVFDPFKGLIYIIFIIVLQQIDGNIISTKILGNITGISEFWVTFSLLLFGGLFGIVGMMVGVPLFAVLDYLIKDYLNEKAKEKGISEDTDFYLDVERFDEETNRFVMLKPHDDPDNPKKKRFWERFRKKKKK